MTHTPSGAGLPDDAATEDVAASTAGPDATAEQTAYVVGLLSTLRTDDDPMPDHVASRIDGVLAELRRAGTPVTDSPHDMATAGLVEESDADRPVNPVTVLPTRDRASGPSSRAFRWVAGAAAALVVVAGGAAVLRSGSGSSSLATSAGSAETSAEAAAPRAAEVVIGTSGTPYRKDALASQAGSLVASAQGNSQSAPQSVVTDAPTTDTSSGVGAGVTPQPAPATSASLLSPQTLAACVEQLSGRPGVTPVAVDQGTYEGKPADIVVLPAPEDPTQLEVWVVGPGCTKETSLLYEWRTIPAPSASP